MLAFLKKIFGDKSTRDLKEIHPLLEATKTVYVEIDQLSNDELRNKTQELKDFIQNYIKKEQDEINDLKKSTESEEISIEEKENIYTEVDKLEKKLNDKIEEVLLEILPQAFAVVKSTARRFTENKEVEVSVTVWDEDLAAVRDNVNIRNGKAYYANEWMAGGNMIKWDMVHYDVQLIGGIVLHHGKIAEMATGEGKTLVATLPIYLNALAGRGVHIVTVNDYLAKRDSEWNGMIFEFHGLKVDCIDKHQPNSEARRKAYLADITYGTNNEFGFDYLRDNMSRNPEELVQRPHHYAIVDEVDSVLIDDARTPLIISGPTSKGDDQEFDTLKPIIEKVYNAQRQLVTMMLADAKKLLQGEATEEQKKKAGELLLRCHHGLPKNTALIKFLSEEGHKVLMLKTESFYMQEQNKNMHIIDDELYFVIDEKHHSADLTEKGINYITGGGEKAKQYMLPDLGAELAEIDKMPDVTPTEKAEKRAETMRNYAIQSDKVHSINQLLKAYTLFERDVDYIIVDNKIKIVDEQTGRVMDGRRWSDGLHQAVEAKENVQVEAATQTYATITLQNYFRMYHKLAGMTGTAITEAGEFWTIYKLDVVTIPTNRDVIRMDANDLVYKTKREKYNAVIAEIQHLTEESRPVLVGTTSVEVSETLHKMLDLRKIRHNVLNAKLHQREADIVAEAGRAGVVTIATNMAGRGTDIKLTPEVREAGGLAIIGTERHDSRRVDRQLRGRSGRQGDPGSSQFFVSLEDNLMRLFASERIAGIMDRLGHKEGDVIQAGMITKSIERAQKKVEENNFGIRKRLLEYDDVMNAQREVIYRKRRHALYGDRLAIDIANMFYDTCLHIAEELRENKDNLEDFIVEVVRTFGVEPEISEKDFTGNVDELADKLYQQIFIAYKSKNEKLAENCYPIVKNVYENSGTRFENIAIPITDSKKEMRVITNIKKCLETKGKEVPVAFEKNITLAIIDDAWKDHLREMDELKQSVQNASYEQKDPLLIYKFEAFNLFKDLIAKINKDICSFLSLGNLPRQQQEFREGHIQRTDTSRMKTSRPDDHTQAQANRTQEQQKPQPVHVEKKVGRNDPCPCGSGKKYKNCHGKE
ncbi:MAG: preprotein translocase subunit SecA [Bacteroidales bacterium]|jgi:preprotein translocase subunit SecA|nr:preprotein translocase subunit SecA [Bacteroidales bacterium]